MWTSEIEKQIQYIGNCARGYAWMYRRDSQDTSNLYNRLNGLSMMLGAISGVLSIVNVSISQSDGSSSSPLNIMSGIFSFGTLFLQGYITSSKFESTSSDLKRQASKYTGIVDNIRRQLSVPRLQREKADDYHRWITKNYEDLNESELDVSDETIEAYRLIAKESGLPFPGDADNTSSNIDIYDEKEEKPRSGTLDPEISRPEVNIAAETIKDAHEGLKYTDANMRYELSRFENM